MSRPSYLSIFLALACALVCAGCGQSAAEGPNVVEVSGKVTLNGKPLPDADLQFIPDQGGAPLPRTDTNGGFVLMYNDGRPGAVPGHHTVVVVTGQPDPVAAAAAASGAAPPPKRPPEPKEYRDDATITADSHDLTIDLGA